MGIERSRSASISAIARSWSGVSVNGSELAVALDQLARLAERLRRGALARGGRAQEREPEDEELVEGEPRPPDLGLGERPRAMDRRERVRAHRKALRREQRGGQVVSDVADVLERLARAGRGASSA